MDHTPNMPGRKWYWVGGLVAVCGVIGFSALIWTALSGFGDDLQQMKAPGRANFTLHEPGTYTVFHEYESVFEGAYFSSPEAVTGLAVSVQPSVGGAALPVRGATVNASYELSGRSGTAIFQFEIIEPGAYQIDAGYGDGADQATVILAIGHDFTGGLVGLILGGMAIMFAGLGGAGIIIVVTFMKRERALSAQRGTS